MSAREIQFGEKRKKEGGVSFLRPSHQYRKAPDPVYGDGKWVRGEKRGGKWGDKRTLRSSKNMQDKGKKGMIHGHYSIEQGGRGHYLTEPPINTPRRSAASLQGTGGDQRRY